MNSIVQTQSFEDRMKDRIRESIGDLITDEELTKLITRAMDEVFFKEKAIATSDGWRSTTKTLPPLLHELVKSLLERTVLTAIKDYIDEHQETVNAIISKTIEDGAAAMLAKAINGLFYNSLAGLQSSMQEDIRRLTGQ